MRQGQQHRRGRGRNNQNNGHGHGHQHQRKGQNPLTRSFESNGPDVKVRGTPAHIAEKYLQLARDAQSSGDHVLAENYLQHAEHYNRIILAYREQQMQQQGEQAHGGSGRGFSQRSEPQDGDEASDEAAASNQDGVTVERPYAARNANGNGEASHDADQQPSLDEGRPPRHNQRYRDRRTRQDRGEGYDRQSDRQPYAGQARDSEQPSIEPVREQRERRQSREGGERDISSADDGQSAVIGGEAAPSPRGDRAEGGSRRRERFGLSSDQPDFLRRPVRRSRRDPDAGFAPDSPPAGDESTPD